MGGYIVGRLVGRLVGRIVGRLVGEVAGWPRAQAHAADRVRAAHYRSTAEPLALGNITVRISVHTRVFHEGHFSRKYIRVTRHTVL